jgi:hypothetical protein
MCQKIVFQSYTTFANPNRLMVALLDGSHHNAIKLKFMCFIKEPRTLVPFRAPSFRLSWLLRRYNLTDMIFPDLSHRVDLALIYSHLLSENRTLTSQEEQEEQDGSNAQP